MAKRGRSEQYVLEEAQVQALLKEAQTIEDRLILELMCYLGMRVSEIAHLRADWVKEGEIRIPLRQPCNCSNCRGEWRAKSKAGARNIPIPVTMADLHTFLQQSPDGFHLTRQALWAKIKKLAKQAKIKVKGLSGDTIFCHALRATAATRLAESGIPVSALAYIMGWANIEIASAYVNIASAKKSAGEALKRLYG